MSSGSGGGEVRLEFLDDVDRATAKVNGKFLKYDSTSKKFVGADAGGGLTVKEEGSNVGTAFRAIKFKLSLSRANSTDADKKKTPDVVSMTLVWRKKLEAKWGHQVSVSLHRDYKGKTPKQLREKLIEAIESTTLVEFTFRDDDSTNRNYYVDVSSATGLESTGYDERGSTTIMLVEP